MNIRKGNHAVSVHKWTILLETLTNDSLALLLFAEEGSSGLLGQLLTDISPRFIWRKVLSKTNQYIQLKYPNIITLIKKSSSLPQICQFFLSLLETLKVLCPRNKALNDSLQLGWILTEFHKTSHHSRRIISLWENYSSSNLVGEISDNKISEEET